MIYPNHIPVNVKEVLDKLSHDKIGTITKTEILEYIRSYLDTGGFNNVNTEAISTTATRYQSDSKEVDRKGDVDVNKKEILLAKTSDELKQQVPAILISDEIPKWVPTGLGHFESRHLVDGKAEFDFPVIFKVPIKIQIVTQDETTTKDLGTFLSFVLGPLQNFGGGNYIKQDKNKHWTLTFPMVHDAPSIEKQSISGDDLSNIWISTFNLEFRYETSVKLKKDVTFSALATGHADEDLSTLVPIIYGVPTTDLNIGTEFEVTVDRMSLDMRLDIIVDTVLGVSFERTDTTHLKVKTLKPCAGSIVVKKGSEIIVEKLFTII